MPFPSRQMPIDPLLPPVPVLALPRLLEVSHVAHRLGVSQEFVRKMIRERTLAAIRLGTRWRVDPVDLHAFLDAQRVVSDQGAAEARDQAAAEAVLTQPPKPKPPRYVPMKRHCPGVLAVPMVRR